MAKRYVGKTRVLNLKRTRFRKYTWKPGDKILLSAWPISPRYSLEIFLLNRASLFYSASIFSGLVERSFLCPVSFFKRSDFLANQVFSNCSEFFSGVATFFRAQRDFFERNKIFSSVFDQEGSFPVQWNFDKFSAQKIREFKYLCHKKFSVSLIFGPCFEFSLHFAVSRVFISLVT